MKLMTKDLRLNALDSSLSSSSALTQKQLKEILHYNPDTGVFTWKTDKRGGREGTVAGWRNDRGIGIEINGKHYRASRLAWLYAHGIWPKKNISFINGNQFDNRIINLREAGRSEVTWHANTPKTNTSGGKGVNWHKQFKKWRARCLVNGRRYSLGCFTDIADAERAVRAFREEHHGEFANHGNGGVADA